MFKSDSPAAVPTIPMQAYLALGFGVLILGTSAIMIAMADAPGPVSGFYRMGIGWLVLTTVALIRKKPETAETAAQNRAAGLRWGALAGLFFGLDLVFWTTGIMISGPTKVTLLGNTSPLWVGLGTMLIFKERHGLKFWVGLGLALFGAALVIAPDLNSTTADWDITSLYGLVSGMFYGAFFLAAQQGRKQIEPLSFVRASTLVSALLLLITALALHQPLLGYPLKTYGWFLAMGVVVQGTGWLIISYAQGHIPAAIVSPTLLGQPVLTAVFSAWLLGERFTGIEALGGAAVLLGVLLVNLKQK